MMESANLHLHHHQFVQSSTSSSSSSSLSSTSTPSWYVASPTNHHHQHHAWNNTSSLNEENQYNKRNDSRHEQNDILVPPPSISNTTSSMIQDIGFQYWNSNTNPTANYINTTSNNEADCYPKFTEMMMMNNQDHHFNSNQIISEKLLLKTLSSSAFQDQFEFDNHGQNMNCSGFGGSLLPNNAPSRGSFSQIFPTINISNLSSGTSTTSDHISRSMNMNLEALDLLTSARFTGNYNEHNLGLVEDILPYPHHHMSQPVMHRPPISPNYNKISSSSPAAFLNGEAIKRASNTIMDPKSSQAAVPNKKSRSETRACPPFKVRKEKLGDRIAALQQLVAPFGKTDTASVLMEAIGYIKFLQNQVETLSVPYMKSSSRIKTHRAQLHAQSQGDGNEDPNRDLKSRGLCLVPLSCMSYVTTDNNGGGGSCGGGIWPHAEYHGCT